MEVKIEKLVYGGDGLAHHEGQTVFVPLVLPGELVSIAPAERKKKFVRGRLERVVEAAPERVPALVPGLPRREIEDLLELSRLPEYVRAQLREELMHRKNNDR